MKMRIKDPMRSTSYDKFQAIVSHLPDKNRRVVATLFDSIESISPRDIEFGNKKVISAERAERRKEQEENRETGARPCFAGRH